MPFMYTPPKKEEKDKNFGAAYKMLQEHSSLLHTNIWALGFLLLHRNEEKKEKMKVPLQCDANK